MARKRCLRTSAGDLRQALLAYVAAAPEAPAIQAAFSRTVVSRRDLLARALAAAHALLRHGVARHDRYLLALENGPEFAYWFWAGQLIGAAVVPTAPITEGRRRPMQIARLHLIASVAQARVLVTGDIDVCDAAVALAGIRLVNGARALQVDAVEHALPAIDVRPTDLAIIQFSSGSTSEPKGCALQHRAVCANAAAAAERFDGQCGDSFFNWLPQFHDLGLMGGVIAPVIIGMRSIVQPTQGFVFDPLSWLRGLSAAGPVHTSAPNFALSLVLRRLPPEPPADICLADVKSIICGGEPIDAATARRFTTALSRLGLRPQAFHPSYGLAECTVLVTANPGVRVTQEPVPGSAARISLGRPVRGAEIRIADSSGGPAPDGSVGQIEIRSPSMMAGYFAAPDATAAIIKHGWLATGDLGFVKDGELFCVGRIKDVIIVAGRNLIAPDVDSVLSRHVGIDPSRIACFANSGHAEQLYVVFEERHARSVTATEQRIRSACFDHFGVTPADVFAVPVGTLPKTSSGKLQRSRLAEMFRNGDLPMLGVTSRAAAKETLQ